MISLLLLVLASSVFSHPQVSRSSSDVEEDEDNQNFEGDMILTVEQKRLIQETSIDHLDHDKVSTIGGTSEEGAKERGGIVGHPSMRWPDNTLSYEIDSSVTGEEKQKVQDTLQGLQAKLDGCITFQEASSGNRVLVQKPSTVSCSSSVGHVGSDTQTLNLGSASWGGCYTTGIIEHEFLHALGVWHQQSRSDRDQYVKINENNIIDGMGHNFDRYTPSLINHFNLPYDFGSVMHYSGQAFGIENANGERAITIETLDPSKQSLIGQRGGVSELDIKLVKEMYGCQATVGGEAVVTSPNFPNNYPNNLRKTETIIAPEGLVLRLEFTAFNVENHGRCAYDHLKIVDGDGTILMDKTCGNALPPVFMSNTNHVDLVFETDRSVTKSGWSVKWSAVSPDVVVSRNYPQEYPNNLEQVETITTEAGKVVVLDFTTFDIEAHHNCSYDFLTIVDDDGTTLMEKTCGNTLPARITSRTNQVHLTFKTDHSVTKSGWVVNVSSATP
jgi:hypothetical protein